MQRFYLILLIIGVLNSFCFCEERIENEEKERKISRGNNEPFGGLSDYFKNAADGARDAAESGFGIFKGFGDQAKEMSESGADVVKGFLGGIGGQINKAKEVFEDGGMKLRDTFPGVPGIPMGGFGTPSKDLEEASDVMTSFFG